MSDRGGDEVPAAPVPDGIRCPRCKGAVWRVWATRRETGRVVRVRTCSACHLRVRTRETIEAVLESK